MNDAKYTVLLLVLALLVPVGISNTFAQGEPGEEDSTSYTLEEIEHSFAVMEKYVIYDENKNITFDIVNSTKNHNTTQLDIDVALDFAIHNNDIMNAVVDPVGQVNELETNYKVLRQAIQELEEGKFRALFGDNSGSISQVNEITFTFYEQLFTPIVSAFGVSEYDIHQTRHHTSSTPILACGGSMSNPHQWNSSTIYPAIDFSGYLDAKTWADSDGYHLVSSYATDHFLYDFTKTDITAPSNCNSGEFREQAVMTVKSSGAKFNLQHDEPNPELLNYIWPKLWWGTYVHWWHVTDGGTKP